MNSAVIAGFRLLLQLKLGKVLTWMLQKAGESVSLAVLAQGCAGCWAAWSRFDSGPTLSSGLD